MGNSTFRGGITPYEGKHYAEHEAIVRYSPKGGLMRYPLNQHIGAPAVPCVAPGDRVLAGQLIAGAGGFVSANILSAVSGTVLAVEPCRTVSGAMADCVVIENDGRYEKAPGLATARDYTKLTPEEIVAAVRDAGIVGLGGAGFPTHVKLSPKNPEKIEYFIVNGAECEPYLTADYRIMLEKGEALVEGCEVILRLFPNARCIIAVEDNKPEAVAHLSRLAEGHEKISVRALRSKYPQGGERNLIYTLTGRAISSAQLPSDAGCIVNNSSTVAAVADAVCRGLPLLAKVIAVTGDAAAKPGNVEVPLGISLGELLEFAGGVRETPEKLVCGGPMMGLAIKTLDAPVVKASSSILCLTAREARSYEEQNCMRCGRCAAACPEKLMPMLLDETVLRGNCEKFLRRYGMECVECGCCSYVCPARRRLAERFSGMKAKTRIYLKEKERGGNGNGL